MSTEDNDVLSFFYPGVEDKIKTVNRAPVVFTAQLLSKQKVLPQTSSLIKRFQLVSSVHLTARERRLIHVARVSGFRVSASGLADVGC